MSAAARRARAAMAAVAAFAAAFVVAFAAAFVAAPRAALAQPSASRSGALRLEAGRFTVLAFPGDSLLGRSMLTQALATDTFPGLPRPIARVTIEIAPDARRFRAWTGTGAPEWGAAIAFPEEQRLVLQGHRASSSAGDPRVSLRHELAHLALHETMGAIPPRWFDEGYASFAAGEWGRDEVLATNLALILRGLPSLDGLDSLFDGGETRAQQGYALAQRAVAELDALDPARGLSVFFAQWRETRSMDQAIRRAYGLTEDAFEKRWKSNTRTRFGGLALFANVTLGAVLMLVLIGPFWLLRRQRDRARLAAMRASDALLDRQDEESALDAMLGSPPGITGPEDAPEHPRPNDDQIK